MSLGMLLKLIVTDKKFLQEGGVRQKHVFCELGGKESNVQSTKKDKETSIFPPHKTSRFFISCFSKADLVVCPRLPSYSGRLVSLLS